MNSDNNDESLQEGKLEDIEIYKGKSFKDLMQDIVSNQQLKDHQIQNQFDELTQFTTDITSATLIAPLQTDLLKVAVQNNEHLIKLASIIQKTLLGNKNMASDNDTNISILSDEEKKQLMNNFQELDNSDEMIQKELDGIRKQIHKYGIDSITTYINNYRISDFIFLLNKYNEMSIKEAFYICGYRSRTTAIRNFRTITGKTPTEYFGRNIMNLE